MDMNSSVALKQQELMFKLAGKNFAEQEKLTIEGEVAKFWQTLQKTNALTTDEVVQLQSDIEAGIRSLRHYSVDVIFSANGQNKIKIYDEKLVKSVGIRSLTNAKLPKDVVFVPKTIQILTGVAASGSEADILDTNFVGIGTEPILTKAEITLGFRGNKLFNQMPTSIFDTRGKDDCRVGEVVLAQSIVFPGDRIFEGEIEVANFASINPNTYIKVTLAGVAAMSIS